MACNRLSFIRLWVGVVIGVAFFSFAEEVDTQQAVDAVYGWLQNQSEHLDENLGTPSLITAYTDEYDVAQFYVVSLEPEGYVVLSADDLSEPVLAFSDKGTFDPDPENPLYRLLTLDTAERKNVAETSELLAEEALVYGLTPYDIYTDAEFENIIKWIDLETASYENPPEEVPLDQLSSISDVRINTLVQSKWSQSSVSGGNCYNYYTPNNYVCGCVATAMSQIIRYHEYPSTGIGEVTKTVYVNDSPQSATTRGGDGSGGAYNYGLMPYNPHGAPDAQRAMIGALCYDAGVSVSMMYDAGGSGAYSSNVDNALQDTFNYASANYMGYSSSGINESITDLVVNSNLNAGYPVYMAIYGSGGHAVVVDGWGYSSGTVYQHVNLGWGGSYDAWYNLPSVGTGYNFNKITAFVYNIFPDKTGEIISGRATDSSGAPITGVTVTATGGYSDTTDSKGYYGLIVPANATYTVKGTLGDAEQTISNVNISSSNSYSYGGKANINFDKMSKPVDIQLAHLDRKVVVRWNDIAPTGYSDPIVKIYRTDRGVIYSGRGQEGERKFIDTSVQNNTTHTYRIYVSSNQSLDLSSTIYTGSLASGTATPTAGKAKVFWRNSSTGAMSLWVIGSSGSRSYAGGVYDNCPAGWSLVGFGDIDNDGINDVLWRNDDDGRMAFWMLEMDGVRKSAGTVYNNCPLGWESIGIGRLGGYLSVLWRNTNDGRMAYWKINTNGSRRDAGTVYDNCPLGWEAVGLTDIDSDGNTDVLWRNTNDGRMAYWMLNSNGTRRSAGTVYNNCPLGWISVGTATIGGDPAVLWRNENDGRMAYWKLNANGTRKSAGTVYSNCPLGWTLAGITDINNDGNSDVLWRNTEDGRMAYWFIGSDGTRSAAGTVYNNCSNDWNCVGTGK